jgi:hypothetical protein
MVLHYGHVQVSLHLLSVVISMHNYSVIRVQLVIHYRILLLVLIREALIVWRHIRYIYWRKCSSLVVFAVHDHCVLPLCRVHVFVLHRSRLVRLAILNVLLFRVV